MPELDNRWDQFPLLEWKDPERTQEVIETVRDVTEAAVEDAELGLLYELARGLHHDRPETQGYVIELGSYKGGSTSAMALGVRDSGTKWKPVIAVDSYGRPHPDLQPGDVPNVVDGMKHDENYVRARETYWKLGLAYDYVCQVVTRTHDIFWELWSNPIRMIFIDSGHLYNRTCSEIGSTLAHIVEDGWMVFHDYYNDEWGEGVIPAVNRLIDEDTKWQKVVYRAGQSFVPVHLKTKHSW